MPRNARHAATQGRVFYDDHFTRRTSQEEMNNVAVEEPKDDESPILMPEDIPNCLECGDDFKIAETMQEDEIEHRNCCFNSCIGIALNFASYGASPSCWHRFHRVGTGFIDAFLTE